MIVSAISASTAYGAFVPRALYSLVAEPALASQAAPVQPQFSRLLDAKLGISILQFRDRDGNVAQTLPSSQQLAAYAKPGAGISSAIGMII